MRISMPMRAFLRWRREVLRGGAGGWDLRGVFQGLVGGIFLPFFLLLTGLVVGGLEVGR